MIINIVILLVMLGFLFLYYKETVVVLAPVSQFLDSIIVPFHFPTGIFGLIALVVLFLAPFKIKNNEKETHTYPFTFFTILVMFSYFISNMGDAGKHWPTVILTIVSVYIYPIILWKCLDTPHNAKLFIRSLIIYLSCVCIYSFYELITNSNPLIEFFISNNIATVGNSDRMRYGLKRLQSFLTLNGALGLTCGFGFVTLTYLKIHFKQYIQAKNIVVTILQIASFLCVFFTGTRSVIAGLLVGSLSFIEPKVFKKNIFQYVSLGLFVLIIINFSDLSGYFSQIIDSYKNTESVSGSDTEMRSRQLDITLYFWSKSPIVGHGSLYTGSHLVAYYPNEIGGAESVWFVLLTDYGAIGCVVFILSILLPIIKLIQNGMPFLAFLPLLFLVDKTMSSIPGISIGFHLLFVVFFLKLKWLSTQPHLPKIEVPQKSNYRFLNDKHSFK